MNENRRLLICSENYYPSVGGVQEVIRQIAERISATGISVTVATSSHSDRNNDCIINNVRVVSFSVEGNLVNGLHGEVVKYQTFLLSESFDTILIKAAQQWSFDAAIHLLPSLSARKVFIPCGFSCLTNVRYKQYYENMRHWMLHFDHLIFYSENFQDINFARRLSHNHIHLLTNGVDEREFSDLNDHDIRAKLGISIDNKLILTVGSLIVSKGHWEVLRAFSKLNLEAPATLIINGNLPQSGTLYLLHRFLKNLLLGRLPLVLEAFILSSFSRFKTVRILNLSRADLINIYKSSDLFVFASHFEYSPLVLFEASASSTAFLSSPVGNTSEIAKWTNGGFTLQHSFTETPNDAIAELTSKLDYLLTNPSFLDQVGHSGRRSIFAGDYTWDKIVHKYLTILF